MHTPSRIIPMYPEEGALHEIGDAGGGNVRHPVGCSEPR